MWFQKYNAQLPPLENEILWSYLLNVSREKLYLLDRYEPTPLLLAKYRQLSQKRLRGYPIAYLIGKKSFWQSEFIVTPDVLIPRPETELLIEKILADNLNPSIKLLELGTGSGAIAISLAQHQPRWQITALDLSWSALQIAITNATALKIHNIYWLQSNWFQNVNAQLFDVIVANPPYVTPNDPHLKGEIRFEPQTALVAPQKGLASLAFIIKTAVAYLTPNGKIYLEHGYDQQEAVQTLLSKYHYTHLQTFQDLNHQARVTTACIAN